MLQGRCITQGRANISHKFVASTLKTKDTTSMVVNTGITRVRSSEGKCGFGDDSTHLA